MMDHTDLKYYGKYGNFLILEQKKILAEINQILKDVTNDSELSPVEHIRSRIKSRESIQEKLIKKGKTSRHLIQPSGK